MSTQVASPRYSIQDDGVLFLLFEPCECLRIVVSDVLKKQPVDQRRPSIHPGHMIKQDLEACLQSQRSTQKISCRNGTTHRSIVKGENTTWPRLSDSAAWSNRKGSS